MNTFPLFPGQDWQPFVQQTSASMNTLSIPSTSSPPPSSRAWGPTSLGGEAIGTRSLPRRNSNITDPIGSRPNSRSDRQSHHGNQRPSASAAAAVAAAASSAAARSLATSAAHSYTDSPYHGAFTRMDNGSSPSFFTALSSNAMDRSTSQSSFPDTRSFAGTPRLVVDEPETTKQKPSQDDQSSLDTSALGDTSSIGLPSPSESMTGAFASMMSKEGDGFPFQDVFDSRSAPKPMRSDTGNSSLSNMSGMPPAMSSAPYMNLQAATSQSSVAQHSGLLSPSAAAVGPSSSNAASFGSNGLSPSQGMLSLPLASPPANAHDRSINSLPSLQQDGSLSELDASLRASPLMAEMLDRLARTEHCISELNRSVDGLNKSVSILLERTKLLATGSLHQSRSMSTPVAQQHPFPSSAQTHGSSEEIRILSNQVSLLSTTMSQLMASSSSSIQNSHPPPAPLAGLGLGPASPNFGASGITTPQLGTFPGTPFHGSNSRFSAMGGASAHDRNSRLSPQPGHSPNPNRRWTQNHTSTADHQTGAMNPPDQGVIVTKWEHLNLHTDLLRSILKYGLGPPNKIQQRALPFLLRGSDIIAQAPPTQERIASYVIPALQLVLNVLRGEAILPSTMGVRGPIALIISTTVDQATQAQRMALGLGSALGIRVHIAAVTSSDVAQDASALIQTQPQIVVGTPQKMMDLFNFLANKTRGAISLADIRMVVLDEVDQLIARNLADHVSTLLRILPTPRVVQYSSQGGLSPGLPASGGGSGASALDQNSNVNVSTTDRQTAIFSNTVPQDVLNFAQSIHLRESVRVLVRREGGMQMTFNSPGPASSAQVPTPGTNVSSVQNGQPVNALGASPANNHANPLADPILSSLRGLRQYYLYVAVTTGTGMHSPHSHRPSHAVEMKLDVITDLLEDIDFGHAVIYTSSNASHEAVTYKLASKGIEALGLHKDMASSTKQQVLAKYRSAVSSSGTNYHTAGRAVVGSNNSDTSPQGPNTPGNSTKKALVVHDLVVQPRDVHQVPLIVFYDLPRNVDEYKEKISCASNGSVHSRPSVCVNVVTGSGGPRGDIEMLRTLECHLGCKMAELPMNPSQIMQF